MADNEQYETRYFGSRTGDVALTCCTRCGTIVWNPQLHERTYHGNEGTNEDDGTDEGTGQIVRDFSNDRVEISHQTGTALDGEVNENPSSTPAIGVSGGAPTPRPVSSPPARGTGRATAAGSGKQARR